MVIKALLAGALVFLVIFALHLIAAWAEDRGWIYYRKGHGRSWASGAAVQELQSLLQPSSRHAIVESRRQELARDEAEESADL